MPESTIGERQEVGQFIAILRKHMPELRERYKIRSLWVFGSYVHTMQRDGSDLDLLVEFGEPPTLLKFIALERHLSNLIGFKVDLVMKDALKPAIGRHVLGEVISV